MRSVSGRRQVTDRPRTYEVAARARSGRKKPPSTGESLQALRGLREHREVGDSLGQGRQRRFQVAAEPGQQGLDVELVVLPLAVEVFQHVMLRDELAVLEAAEDRMQERALGGPA